MKSSEDSYKQGYAAGLQSTLGGHLAEATFGFLKDDPHGHYAAGYRDGAARKPGQVPPPLPVQKTEELNPFDDATAVLVSCPKCGRSEWIQWKFLGNLLHGSCGYSWYAGPALYLMMQLNAALSAGRKGVRYFNSGSTSGQGAWIAAALGWIMGALFGFGIRLTYGVCMLPFQVIAGLLDSHDAQGQTVRVQRWVVLGLFIVLVTMWVVAIRG